MTGRATGPGALCWCDCGRRLPDHKRPHAQYLDGGHRAKASRERAEARRRAEAGLPPSRPGQAHRKRTRPPRPPVVMLSVPPSVAFAARGALRALAAAIPPAPETLEFSDQLDAAIDRYRRRLTNGPR